jgi:DNA-binding transcriptional ArsR family regulator
MDAKTQARYEARARILKALAHPSRLCLVDRLSREEMSVAQLTQAVGADMSTVSKHLSLLKSAGLVLDDKRGNQVFYRLAAPCVLDFFSCIESVLQSQVQTQIDLMGDLPGQGTETG